MVPPRERARSRRAAKAFFNLLGVALGVKSALPHLKQAGGGAVVITASLLALVGDPDMPAYGAMKGGLLAGLLAKIY